MIAPMATPPAAPTRNPSANDPVASVTAKPTNAPTSIIPSSPRLSTPARSEICSPSPASSSGTATAMVPAINAVMNVPVSKTSIAVQAFCLEPRGKLIGHGEYHEDQCHEDEEKVVRQVGATRGGLAANAQDGKKRDDRRSRLCH